MGTPLGSRYELDARLGVGGMGEVWRGHTREGSAVAVKLLRSELAGDQDLLARFVQERNVLVRVTHRNVVRVRDLVVEGDTVAIIMDLVEGRDLRAELNTNATMRPADALLLMAQIFEGLDAIHAAGVVHRDLKPENILLDYEAGHRVPKITDFGVARLLQRSRLTRQTSIIGTPEYMSPEQAQGRDVTAAADLYSAGVVLYELLVGVTPFAGAHHPVAILRAHIEQQPGRPDGLADPLWNLVAALLNKEPVPRGTAAAAARHCRVLSAQLEGQPALVPLEAPPATVPMASAPAPPDSPAVPTLTPTNEPGGTSRPPRRSPKRRYQWATLGLLLVAAVVAFILLQSGSSHASHTTQPTVSPTTPAPTPTPTTTLTPSPTPTQMSGGPNPGVRNSGTIIMDPGNSIDLDSRLANWSQDVGNGADLTMSSDGSLSDSNGIIPLKQKTPATYADCASATGITNAVDRSNISDGQQYCVRTDQGRQAVVQIKSFRYASDGSQDIAQLTVLATSWEPAASPSPDSISLPTSAAVRNSGNANLLNGNTLDLDSRQPNWGENGSSGADIELDSQGDLSAQSGQIIPLPPSAPGTFAGCTSATGVLSSVDYNMLAVGQRYCVRTDEARYALLTLTKVVPVSNGSTGLAEVDLKIVSWDFQAVASS